MKTILPIAAFTLLTSFSASAWTLVDVARSHFTNPKTNVYIATNTCTHAGYTSSTMQSLVSDAIDAYWDKVPTSDLELTVAGTKAVDLSADDLTTAAGKATVNTIIVGCSANATTFMPEYFLTTLLPHLSLHLIAKQF